MAWIIKNISHLLSVRKRRDGSSALINPSGAETRVFRAIYVNSTAADALAMQRIGVCSYRKDLNYISHVKMENP